MTKEELTQRIEKCNLKIEKINKRIEKWSKGMRPEAVEICKAFGDGIYGTTKYQEARIKYDEFKKNNIDGIWSRDPKLNDLFNSNDWNKGPNFNELYSAYRDLAETKNTLEKYRTQFDKLVNFENEEKIEVIWSFLQDWKKSTDEFFHSNCLLYHELRSNYEEAFNEYIERYNKQHEVSYDKLNHHVQMNLRYSFREEYYEDIHPYSVELYTYGGNHVDEEKLNKWLDKEVKNKYEDLIHRITEKAGKILDAKGLHIGARGEIDGYVIGDRNTVHVETITAGGYNIQIRHYRTLVNIIKR